MYSETVPYINMYCFVLHAGVDHKQDLPYLSEFTQFFFKFTYNTVSNIALYNVTVVPRATPNTQSITTYVQSLFLQRNYIESYVSFFNTSTKKKHASGDWST